ncbi:MAG: transcription elongation factor GreA [Anaerolineaceae bacterium]|nr:transcription elongation factor GreA [Anaerolineaceae bacterium]
MTPSFLTEEGYKKMQDELDDLRQDRRQEIALRLREAIEGGDITENAEFEAAKNEQAFVEGRIKELEIILANARIIEPDKSPNGKNTVQLGSKVKLKIDKDSPEQYVVVGAAEANPIEGKISNESPLGRAIIDQTVNTVVEVDAPDGKMKVKILKIE